ncbi:MAG: LicD family protein [Clostridia bacterium]|nr:LicD family protein [Clostridia bacterium]
MSTLQEHQQVLLELVEEIDRICQKHDIPYILFAGSSLGAVRHQGFIPWDDDVDLAMLRKDYERFLEVAPKEIDPEKYYVQAEYSDHWPMYYTKFRKNNTACIEKHHPKDKKVHQGIYVDICPCDNAKDNAFLRKMQFYASRVVIAKSMAKKGYETDSVAKKIIMVLSHLFPNRLFHRIAVNRKDVNSKMVHSFFGGTSRYEKGQYPREWLTERVMMPFAHLTVPVSAHYDEMLTTQYGDYMRIPSEEERKCKVHAVLVDTEHSYEKYIDYQDNMTIEEYSRSIR